MSSWLHAKWARHAVIALVALVSLAVGLAWLRSPGAPVPVTEETLDRAIDRALGALLSRPLRADEACLVMQASFFMDESRRQRARTVAPPRFNEGFPGAVERAYWDLGRDRPVIPLPLPVPSDVTPTRNTIPQDPDDYAVGLALFRGLIRCAAGQPRAAETLLDAAEREGIGAYVPLHQLAYLMFGVSRGCVEAADAEPFREPLARRTYAELLAEEHPVDDLNLQRMVVLCQAGLCHWVSEEQIAAVLGAQRRRGTWRHGVPRTEPNFNPRDEHATALAVYALAAWRARGVLPPE